MSSVDGNLRQTVEGMREILREQTRHIDLCLMLLLDCQAAEEETPFGHPDTNRVIKPIIHMVGISARSVLKLSDEVGLNSKDCYPVARSIAEGAANIAYLMASDVKVAQKALRHAEVRAYRDLVRHEVIGDWRFEAGWNIKIDDVHRDRLEKMSKEFIGGKGQIVDWNKLTVPQRLTAASAVYPSKALVSLMASYHSIYKHASEVVHSSYYGALTVWGHNGPEHPPKDREDLYNLYLGHQFTALMAAIFGLAGVVECFSYYSKIPNLISLVDREMDRMRALPSISSELDVFPPRASLSRGA